jgi:hypothetical protein
VAVIDVTLTLDSNRWEFCEMYIIKLPVMICMGIIHDFRRPRDGKYTESTMGDHNNLREYG